MLVVSLAAITKQRTALVQTDARPNATQPAYCLVPDFFRIAMLNCCSASSIMCEYPALRIFSRSRAFLSLLIFLRPSDRVSSLKSTSGFWRYQTISTPRYSDHPSVGNLDAAEIEARNDLLNRLLFLEQLSHSFSAFVRQGSLPPPILLKIASCSFQQSCFHPFLTRISFAERVNFFQAKTMLWSLL